MSSASESRAAKPADAATITPALIIGAGPAGLLLSRALTQRGQQHLLVERGDVAASWQAMPDALHLVSPWWTNTLDVRGLLRHLPLAKIGASDFAAHLREYQQRHQIQVLDHCTVHCAETHAVGGFEIQTSCGVFHSDALVCATGYFSNPAAPSPPYASDASVPMLHAAQITTIDSLKTLARGKAIVILGRKISAGQLFVELHDAGAEVHLSCRLPLEFRRDGVAGALKDFAYYFYEELLITRKPQMQAPTFPPMDGGRSRFLVETNAVPVHPPISAIHDGRVSFTDGEQIDAGLVIHATGYQPALTPVDSLLSTYAADGLPVCSAWESVDTKRLYLFGLANRQNYRSRTIRGVRREAGALADRIVAALRTAS